MVLAAELLGNKEIIFPEITALAIGYILSEKRGWNVNDRRMLFLITLCACAGLLSSVYLPPLGAVTLLAMLIPEDALISYPLQIAVGITIYLLLARMVFASEKSVECA